MDEKCLILADDLNGSAWRRFAALARSFRQTHGKASLLVSTYEIDETSADDLPELQDWKNLLDYEKCQGFWTSAYQRTDDLLDRLRPAVAGQLRVFYHEVADCIFRVQVTDEILNRTEAPVLVLTQGSDPSAYRNRGFEVRSLNTGSPVRFILKAAVRKAGHLVGTAGKAPARAESEPCSPVPVEPEEDSSTVAVLIEDTGTNVNLVPGISVLGELRRRGLHAVVVSTRPPVLDAVRALGFAAVNLAVPSLRLNLLRVASQTRTASAELARLTLSNEAGVLENVYVSEIRGRLLGYIGLAANITSILDRLHSSSTVSLVLVVNESAPLAAVAANWAARKSLPALGLDLILVGNRPDNRNFPAPVHLVYGEQIRSVMVGVGVAGESIHVVGTPTFDSAFSRNLEEDRMIVADRILNSWNGQKLIVVGTESLPQPLVELTPVLRTLTLMTGVHVVLKVHPADSLDFYRRVAGGISSGTSVEVVKECDLHALLNVADLLICIISNIIIAAAILDTPTLVCDFSGKRRPLDFVAEGISFGCFSVEDIEPKVAGLLFDPDGLQEWASMRQRALERFNGPADGQSHRRVAQFVIKSIEKV